MRGTIEDGGATIVLQLNARDHEIPLSVQTRARRKESMATYRLVNSLQQRSPGKRFGKISLCTHSRCFGTCRRFIVRRDEDSRSWLAAESQSPVQLKAGHARKTNVENQAVSCPRRVSFDERFRGIECDHGKAAGGQYPLHRWLMLGSSSTTTIVDAFPDISLHLVHRRAG